MPTYTVDPDTVLVAFDADDHLDDAQMRAAIDEIATRVVRELDRRGIVATVKREYCATGGFSDADVDPAVYDAVLIENVDDLRAAVLGG